MPAEVPQIAQLFNALQPETAQQAPAGPKRAPVDPKAIWTDDEVDAQGALSTRDPRPTAEYTVRYRQRVTSEDVFLGMGGKLNSMSHADDIVAYVALPALREKQRAEGLSVAQLLRDVDLDVVRDGMTLRCPQYVANVAFPQPVNPKGARAEWNAEKGELVVTAPVCSEFSV